MKTAVDYLIEQLAKNGVLHSSDIAKAKEMQKKNIMKAFDSGHLATWNETAEQYYNETFNE